MKYTSSGWGACVTGPWVYNSGNDTQMTKTASWPTPPCGSGTYSFYDNGQVYNGAWRGGVLVSGNHTLPA